MNYTNEELVALFSRLPPRRLDFIYRLLKRLQDDPDDSFFRAFQRDQGIVHALLHADNFRALDRWLRRNSIRLL
jgi:hypothetical protein